MLFRICENVIVLLSSPLFSVFLHMFLLFFCHFFSPRPFHPHPPPRSLPVTWLGMEIFAEHRTFENLQRNTPLSTASGNPQTEMNPNSPLDTTLSFGLTTTDSIFFGTVCFLLESSGSMFASQPLIQLYLNPPFDFHSVSNNSSLLVGMPSKCPKNAYTYFPLLGSTRARVILLSCFIVAVGILVYLLQYSVSTLQAHLLRYTNHSFWSLMSNRVQLPCRSLPSQSLLLLPPLFSGLPLVEISQRLLLAVLFS